MTQDTEQVTRNNRTKWWGINRLPADRWCSWRIGSFSLFIRRTSQELFCAWIPGKDPLNTDLNFKLPDTESPDLAAAESARYLLHDTNGIFSLALALADRSFVVRPEHTLCIPPGESARLYVSTGLWLKPSMDGVALFEMPMFRPSDTWFGANTRTGELCYLSRTRARTSESDATIYPHRAITAISVVNRSKTTLAIERLRVPVPHLSLYVDSRGVFVTDAIRVKLTKDQDEVVWEIDRGKDSNATYRAIADPREDIDDDVFTGALARLFA